MKILIIPDVYGWVCDTMARGIRQHSKYKVDIMAHGDFIDEGKYVNPSYLWKQYDLVYLLIWKNLANFNSYYDDLRPLAIKSKAHGTGGKTKIILGCGMNCWEPDWKELTSKRIYKLVSGYICTDRIFTEIMKVAGIKTYHNSGGINTDFYKPAPSFPKGRFTAGWAGNFYRSFKRTYLLPQLNHPVKIQKNHGTKFFVKNRDQTEMVKFYQSLNAYVLVSTNEGGASRTIYEAMSCGLPVVTTNCGGEIPHIIDNKWIVPVEPESEVIKQMNERLAILAEHPEIASEVGKRNRTKMVTEYDWKVKTPKFDEIFHKIYIQSKP